MKVELNKEVTVNVLVLVPRVPEAFHARYPVSVKAPHRTQEKTSGTQGWVLEETLTLFYVFRLQINDQDTQKKFRLDKNCPF